MTPPINFTSADRGESLAGAPGGAAAPQPAPRRKSWPDMVAHFFSFVFSPLLVPTYGVMLALWCSTLLFLPESVKWRIIGLVFIITGAIPAILIALLKLQGLVSDFGLNHQKERTLPYCITCICYLATGYYFYAAHFPGWMPLFMAGAAVAVVISIVVNIWWKISAHLAGMGGMIGLMLRIASNGDDVSTTFAFTIIAILLTGCVASSRVQLGRHTLMQTICGTLNGAICVYVMSAFAA